MSFKFGISAVKGPTEVLAMSRICVEPDSTALHARGRCLYAACLDCTSCEAREKISRLEAFNSYGCDGKTQLGLADLDETMSSLKEDGFKALKFFLHLDPVSSAEGNVPVQLLPQILVTHRTPVFNLRGACSKLQ